MRLLETIGLAASIATCVHSASPIPTKNVDSVGNTIQAIREHCQGKRLARYAIHPTCIDRLGKPIGLTLPDPRDVPLEPTPGNAPLPDREKILRRDLELLQELLGPSCQKKGGQLELKICVECESNQQI